MPKDNSDAYREMYEMGQRLIALAEEGGYSPDEESEEMDESDTEGLGAEKPYPVAKKRDKVSTALSMFGK